MATTVPCVESDILVPLILPARVTLEMGALAGGHGGLLGNVIVTVMVEPRLALPPGATEIETTTLSKLDTDVLATR